MLKKIFGGLFVFIGLVFLAVAVSSFGDTSAEGVWVIFPVFALVNFLIAAMLFKSAKHNSGDVVAKRNEIISNFILRTGKNNSVEVKNKAFIDRDLVAYMNDHFDKTIKNGSPFYVAALSVDDKNKEFFVLNNKTFYRFDYEKLIDFNYIQDGESVVSGKALSTIAGGLTFGFLGALAGSSGKRKTKEKVTNASIYLKLNDLKNSSVSIDILKNQVSSVNFIQKEAEEYLGLLNYIKVNSDEKWEK